MGGFRIYVASKTWTCRFPESQMDGFWCGLLSATRTGKLRDWTADLELEHLEEALEKVF